MKKVFFLDIDDCLIRTSALTGEHLKVVSNQLSVSGIKEYQEITREFARSFRRLYDQHQSKYMPIADRRILNSYLKRLAELEKPVVEKFGEIKRWSREICLYIAAEKSGVNLSNEILVKTADALWKKITDYAVFYPDAEIFLDRLKDEKIPFYLITSSDSRLMKNDKTELFHYDPVYSRDLKLRRLQRFLDLGIPQNHIFIGDPIDKPKTRVFEEAMNQAKKENPYPFESVMVSDSVTNDLIPAHAIGMNKLVLLDRSGKLKLNEYDVPVRIMSKLSYDL